MKEKFEDFELIYASLLKDGGIRMKHILKINNDNVIDYIYGNEDITIEPHQDFVENFDALKPTVAKIFGFDSFKTALLSNEFETSNSQCEIIDAHYQEVLNRIKVKGVKLVKWCSEHDNRVVIEAEYNAGNDCILKLNTKEIHLSLSVVGTEDDIESACEQLSLEAFKYRYEGKREQLEAIEIGI